MHRRDLFGSVQRQEFLDDFALSRHQDATRERHDLHQMVDLDDRPAGLTFAVLCFIAPVSGHPSGGRPYSWRPARSRRLGRRGRYLRYRRHRRQRHLLPPLRLPQRPHLLPLRLQRRRRLRQRHHRPRLERTILRSTPLPATLQPRR